MATRTIGWRNGGTNAYSTKERSDANEAGKITMRRGNGEAIPIQKAIAPASDETRGLTAYFIFYQPSDTSPSRIAAGSTLHSSAAMLLTLPCLFRFPDLMEKSPASRDPLCDQMRTCKRPFCSFTVASASNDGTIPVHVESNMN